MTSSSGLNVSRVVLDDALHRGENEFPVMWACDDSGGSMQQACDWVADRRDELLEQSHRHGAVLFRNFGVSGPEDFDAFIAAFDLPNFPYEQSLSNAVRVNFTPRVFSANEAPSDVKIFLHHEMAQTPIYPERLFFFCKLAATEGGATPICRSDWLMEEIIKELPEFAAACQTHGLKYTNIMPAHDDAQSGMGRSWQSTLRAADRDEAEDRLRTMEYSWQWLDDGCLKATTPVLPAVKTLDDGRRVFFNQLIAAFRGWKDERNDPSKAITFGNDQPLDRNAVLRVAEIAETVTFDIPWQSGDVALVDNVVAMHGRRTFVGKRKVLASLVCVQPNGVLV